MLLTRQRIGRIRPNEAQEVLGLEDIESKRRLSENGPHTSSLAAGACFSMENGARSRSLGRPCRGWLRLLDPGGLLPMPKHGRRVVDLRPIRQQEEVARTSLRPASRTIATRWTTLTTAFRALARGAAACRAPAVIVVVGDRTSLVVVLSESNGSVGGAIAANHRAQII